MKAHAYEISCQEEIGMQAAFETFREKLGAMKQLFNSEKQTWIDQYEEQREANWKLIDIIKDKNRVIAQQELMI